MAEIRHVAAFHISHSKSVVLKMRKWNNFAFMRWSQKQSSGDIASVSGSKRSRYCFATGIAESDDSFIDSFGMSHVTRRHLCSPPGPCPPPSQAARWWSLCPLVRSIRKCILYLTLLHWKYLKKSRCFSLIQFIKPVETKFVIWGYKSRLTGLEIKGNLMSHYHKHTYFEMGVRLADESSTQESLEMSSQGNDSDHHYKKEIW